MTTKLTTLTHKIAIKLNLVAELCTICSSRSSGQSGNFWIYSRTLRYPLRIRFRSGYSDWNSFGIPYCL